MLDCCVRDDLPQLDSKIPCASVIEAGTPVRIISSIANSGNNTHNITVPANTAQLKVMLYWHDPAAAVLASQTLVNDLDLEVRDPFNALTLPFILDTVVANITDTAITGVDHINNIEQVVVTNPASGSFTLTVKGTSVVGSPMPFGESAPNRGSWCNFPRTRKVRAM